MSAPSVWSHETVTTTATGDLYIPGGLRYFTNNFYSELKVRARRTTAGDGGLTVTVEEYDPGFDAFYPLLDGAGATVTFLAWGNAEADAAGESQILRIGNGILGADADAVLAIATGEQQWYDMQPPKYWRFKCVESGTASTFSLTWFLYRG